MNQSFVRNGEIMGDLFIPNADVNNKIGLVWLPGLPNHPIVDDMTKPLAEKGFTVLNARYPGSWQSYGDFGPSTSLEGAKLGLELLSKKSTVDLRSQENITWDVDHLVVVGNSYGGAIAMSALGSSSLADAAIVFCPLLDPGSQNENPALPEEDLSSIYSFLKRCHENVFRNIDKEEWDQFTKGKHHCNPMNYLDEITDRPLLIIHGKEDKSIRSYHSEKFHNLLLSKEASKAELLLKDGVGHGRNLRTSTAEYWTKWLIEKLKLEE